MRTRHVLICAAAAAMLAVAASSWPQSPVPKLSLGDPAPPIDVRTVKGKPVDVGPGDRVFIVEFWATWCGPCRVSVPHLTALQKKYGGQGLVVVGISDEDLGTVLPFVAEMGEKMGYTVAIDNGQTTAYRYLVPFGADSIPHAFVVDKSGRLVWHGHPLDSAMEKLVVSLLKEKNVKPPAGSSPTKDQGSTPKARAPQTPQGFSGSGSKG